jgi:beta-phosphoglucomutase
MIALIVFDAEGVVVDTERIWDRGQEEFLARRGLPYDRARVKPLLTGRSLVEGVRALKEAYGFAGDDEELARERLEIVREGFASEVEFVDGFLAFFERVRRAYATCVATAMDEQLLQLVDGRLALRRLFGREIFTLADVGHVGKPRPDLFLRAAGHFGAHPSQCVVIEDAPHGIEAARRAGMRAVGMATTYPRELLADADQVVATFGEIDLSKF